MIPLILFLAVYRPIDGAIADDSSSIKYFEDALRSRYYVDKSNLIKYIWETLPTTSKEKMLVINAPPGFGKSTNLNMLKMFLEKHVDRDGIRLDRNASTNYKLFVDHKLNVYKDGVFFEKHFAKYPVLHLNLNNINMSAPSAKNCFSDVIKVLKNQHSYLPASWFSHQYKSGDASELKECLANFLDDMYHFFNQTSVVLIDANETPVMSGFLGKRSTKGLFEFNEFMKKVFYKDLCKNEKVGRIIVFRRVTGEGTYNPSNPSKDAKHLSIFEDKELSKYFGFTDEEVDHILHKIKFINRTLLLEKVRFWYGGYRVKLSESQLYSFSSVLKFLNGWRFQPHLARPAHFCDSEMLFDYKALGSFVEEAYESEEFPTVMTEGLETFTLKSLVFDSDFRGKNADDPSSKQAVMQYLTEYGFFTANYNNDGIERLKARWGVKFQNDRMVSIRIPNFETKLELAKCFNNHAYYFKKYNVTKETQKEFNSLYPLLNPKEYIIQEYGRTVDKIFSVKKPKNEGQLIGALYGLINQNKDFRDVRRELFRSKEGTMHLYVLRKFGCLVSFNFAYNELDSKKAFEISEKGAPELFLEAKECEKHFTLKAGFYFNASGYWSISYRSPYKPYHILTVVKKY